MRGTFTRFRGNFLKGAAAEAHMAFEYKGDLLKPIRPSSLGLLSTSDDELDEQQRIEAERTRRMGLLFDAHGIRAGDWSRLCFALAEAHLPGFRIAKARSGRPAKWDDFDRALLFCTVMESGLPLKRATEKLVHEEPWKSKCKGTRGAKTLYDEYTRADPRMIALMKSAKAFDDLPEEEKERARNLSRSY